MLPENTNISHHSRSTLQDTQLLQHPVGGVMTPLELFVCTYSARFGNLHVGFQELTDYLAPREGILAINSNFGHKASPGYERFLKVQKMPIRGGKIKGRVRKLQGDGTCFNSAIEPVITIQHPGISLEKFYLLKCFPTTGETQIPGIICEDLSDGPAVLDAFIDYLNTFQVGDLITLDALEKQNGLPQTSEELYTNRDESFAPNMRCYCSNFCTASRVEHIRKPVVLVSECPKMLNYKFRLVCRSSRIIVNLWNLATFMQELENSKAILEETTLEEIYINTGGYTQERNLYQGELPLPPYLIRETKPPIDGVKVSVCFRVGSRSPRVQIFRSGKINILGASSKVSARRIYTFFTQLFEEKWCELTLLQPRKDSELRISYS